MKKLFLLLSLFLFPVLSNFAQNVKHINIIGRTVGAGTYIDVPITVATNCYLEGLQITVKRAENMLMPFDFYLDENFYQGWNNGWSHPQPYYDWWEFRFATVGNPVVLHIGDKIGTFKTFVDYEMSGNVLFSTEIKFFDGETDWSVGYRSFNVIQLPFERYGNHNNDGGRDIKDGVELWKWVGLIPNNDTMLVAFDLDGSGGEITDYDEYLFLDNLVNKTPFPIHSNNTITVGGSGGNVPISVTWGKNPDGKWGLYAKEPITNGNVSGKNLSLPVGSNLMFKEVNGKNYFYGKIPVGKQILVSDFPDYSITGKFNNNRPIRVAAAVTDVEDNKTIPINFSLEQNYPNPFNPSTVISYQIPHDGLVTLKIYDITGAKIRTLINENKPAGKHEVKFDASGLPSGVYMYKISSGNFVQVKKMLLMK